MKKHTFVVKKGARGRTKWMCDYVDPKSGLLCALSPGHPKHEVLNTLSKLPSQRLQARLAKQSKVQPSASEILKHHLLRSNKVGETTQHLTTFEGGATRSSKAERRELIPKAAIDALARRLALGAERHGVNNWRKGGEDFRQATINHLLDHVFDYIEHGGHENVDAIICNAAFLCEFEARNAHPGVVRVDE